MAFHLGEGASQSWEHGGAKDKEMRGTLKMFIFFHV